MVMMLHRVAGAAMAGVLALLTLSGCGGSDEEPTPGAEPDGGADAPETGGGLTGRMECGELAVANPACASCADASCCDEGEACAADPACAALRACIGSCDPEQPACADACRTEHADGAALDAALSSCRMRWCADSCYDGADVECGFSMGTTACQACAQQACCDLGALSNGQASFWSYGDCVQACGDAACFAACASASPDGYGYYTAFAGCLGTSCAQACALPAGAACGAFYSASCGGCVASSCCTQSTACHQDPACVSLRGCRDRCGGDAACLQACGEQYAAGAEAAEALNSCLQSACAGDC